MSNHDETRSAEAATERQGAGAEAASGGAAHGGRLDTATAGRVGDVLRGGRHGRLASPADCPRPAPAGQATGTKLSGLKAAAEAGDWRGAIAIAARFPQLGAQRAAILDAHMAWTNPRFAAQLKRCPDAMRAAGAAALCEKYGITAPRSI